MAIALAITRNLLDAQFGAQALSPPATYHVALFSTVPNNVDVGGVEISAVSYARVAVANNATEWPAATVTVEALKVNANVVVFPTATEAWGIIKGIGLYDAVTAGNLIAVGATVLFEDIILGNTPQLDPGDIIITLADKS